MVFPRMWLGEFFANLALHAWVAQRAPDSLDMLTTLPRLAATGAGENIEHHLPDIDFRNWRELAEALPRLVEQLLAEALPSHDDR